MGKSEKRSVYEIVVISGKGGTGKTTLSASLVPFIPDIVIADCDVDAPDLHILLNPETESQENFSGMQKAKIHQEQCTGCGICAKACKFGAIASSLCYSVNPMKCEGCGVCEYICPSHAVTMHNALTGTLFRSRTEYGPMIHARLVPGEETSGKLVSLVRKEAKRIAEEHGLSTILIDGSPGIGCNVISSITGADLVVIVTEPTESGLHDLLRALEISRRFSQKVMVVINKADISPVMATAIRNACKERKVSVHMEIPFNEDIVRAITEKEIPSLACKDFFSHIGWNKFVSELS